MGFAYIFPGRGLRFPISRDPPEGGTSNSLAEAAEIVRFPISRDPPEGGTFLASSAAFRAVCVSNF